MAIKVIKHGKEIHFKKTCPKCGCEFEFDATDLETDYSICLASYPCQYHRYIKCPDCGEWIYHDTYMHNPHTIDITYTSNKSLDCNECPNKPDWNNPVVGDTPCTWCKKNAPYCTTVTDSKFSYKDSFTDLDKYKSPIYTNTLDAVPAFTTNYTTDIAKK